MSQTDWSDVGMTDLLPTGMATLLLADVEGSTRLWESQSKEMTAAVARLDEVLTEVVAQHQGVRPVEQGGDDARQAMVIAADMQGYVVMVPDGLECLAHVAGDAGSHREAARLFGAGHAARLQAGVPRLTTLDADHDLRLAAVREALGESDFQAAWDEGAALTIEEAIAYARRGRGERKRPSKGWASLTPTELDVVRLACDGLGNKEIAARLFVSRRTVQAHLSHVYSKLGVSSRMQLAQEASRH
jgi:DNA-binding NarL/FixJ family response regulator